MWGHSPDSDPFLVAHSPSPKTYNRTALDEDRAASLRNAALCGGTVMCARDPTRMATSLSVRNGRNNRSRLLSSPPQPPDSRPSFDRRKVKSPCLVLAWWVVLGAIAIAPAWASSTGRHQQAREQFEKAEQMREALNGRPEAERTRKEYQRVADAYRKVYYVAPGSSKADASVIAVAEILAEMGRQFEPGDKYLHAAIGEYEFLRREYPGSKYRVQALFTEGQIYKEDLGDNDAARQVFEEFCRHYPRNHLAAEAKQALAELDKATPAKKASEEARLGQKAPSPKKATEDRVPEEPAATKPALTNEAPLPSPSPGSATDTSLTVAKKKSPLPMVTGIRHWSTPDYTRVAIDVDAEVKYEAGRVPDPDRIFFDLPETKLASVLVGKSFEVRDGFLKKIRVAQYQPGYTRVVLEVADVSDYSAFLLPNPYRLIIDIHKRQPQSQTQVAQANAPRAADGESATKIESEKSYRSVERANETQKSAPPATKEPATRDGATPRSAATAGTASKTPPRKVVVDNDDDDAAGQAAASATEAARKPATRGKSSAKAATTAAASADPLFSGPRGSSGPELKATTEPTTAPTAIAVAPRAKDAKKSRNKAVAETATREAEPTSSGDRSLTRALGLKIGRIVVDAGHGGHDTGTIGPNGLTEKELVLDIALRLGRLLETRLGADVIYTRDDDTFIPLETRTAIANEHQADLFVSIHANSSSDPAARGVETYYLNFTSNPDALEVAARENAVSQKSIFELQDLVKKITLKEKIEESRELASDVQQSLYAGLTAKHSTLRDRGVKKAPFVVLIGANMPSILAEISFVSNPTDEAKLETSEYRQKIAESLYKGVAKYAGGLSGVKVAAKFSKMADAGN
jgi:N-acetylmuramoyl-L-alanine amidase